MNMNMNMNMNLGLKRETMWNEFPPYKNILISIDALPHLCMAN